ncbi:tetratricopeptide repeat protein [Algoriphagus namhaensis]
MKKSQLIIAIIGIAAVIALYSLPKIVVDNEESIEGLSEGQSSNAPATVEMHEAELSPEQAQSRDENQRKLAEATSPEEKVASATDLGAMYRELGKFDSAAYYLGVAAEADQTLSNLEKAGEAYYEAFTFALDADKVAYLAEQTRNYLNQVLVEDPARLDLKTKVAMTYVSTSNPMQGITMLREILAEDPQNEEALFNMGILSMQSGQYKRATERFEELIKYHPNNLQGQFYLGVSYFEANQKNKAKAQFEEVQKMTEDPMILGSIQGYLDQL